MTSRWKRIATRAVQTSAQRATAQKTALGGVRAFLPADKAASRVRGETKKGILIAGGRTYDEGKAALPGFLQSLLGKRARAIQ